MNIVVLGPSSRFLSGITYFTIRLANALTGIGNIEALLFRHMLPLRLFPGWKRVGKVRTDERFLPTVGVFEILDWYNPLTWMRGWSIVRKADVLIIPWWTSSVAHMYIFLQLFSWKKVDVVVDFHEPVDPLEDAFLPLRVYARFTGRIVRTLANGYIAHTRYDRDLIVKRYHIPPGDVAIIPHGLYDQYAHLDKEGARQRLGIREQYVILFFGLLRKFKGVQYLIEGFEQLPDKLRLNARLCIVGEAWEDQESVMRARSSPDTGRITLVDRYVSDEEVALFYSASDVFVGPYTKEAHDPCAVCHIAMSYGMPVVASRTGGMVESLGSYAGVFFVPPEEPEAIAHALVQISAEPGTQYPVPEELRWDKIALKWRAYLRRTGRL